MVQRRVKLEFRKYLEGGEKGKVGIYVVQENGLGLERGGWEWGRRICSSLLGLGWLVSVYIRNDFRITRLNEFCDGRVNFYLLISASFERELGSIHW